jgi:N-acetylglutamate synthase
MIIRLMQQADFDKICLLWKKINIAKESVIQDRENFEIMLRFNHSTCFVAEENGKIIGSIFGLFNGRRAWIHHLGVHPKWQNKKIGTKMLKLTEKSLKKIGTKRILLSVDFKNLKVVPFYEKNGYRVSCDSITLGKNI